MRYVFGKGFRYAAINFENALKEAQGKYIFLSDQDDVWHTGKVSKMLQALKVYDLVQCNCNIIGTVINIKNARELGNGSWGKIDFLVNHCGYTLMRG